MSLFNWGKKKASVRKVPPRVRLQLEVLEDRLVPTATTLTVAAGDVATLISDIAAANASNTPTIINLTQGTYDFTAADNNTFGPNALPAITGDITINGNGAVLERDPSLGQNTPFRFFYISGSQVASPSSSSQSTGAATGTLTLENLTLEGGLAQGGNSDTGGGGLGAGGAIFNQGNLTLNGVTATRNMAAGGNSGTGSASGGGGIGQDGQGANGGGFGSSGSTGTSGAIGVGGASSSAGGFGGGGGSGSTGGVGGGGGSGSTAGYGAGDGNGSIGGGGLGAGGAVFNMYGTTTLINSTLASNLAQGGSGGTNGDGDGGGVFNLDGTLNVVTSTLADNSTTGAANGGGAVYNLAMGTTSAGSGVPSTVTLTDSILADSIASNDLVNDQNISTAGSAVVNVPSSNTVMAMSTLDSATTIGTPNTANPQLGLLFNYGGQTATIPLLAGSTTVAATSLTLTSSGSSTLGSTVTLTATIAASSGSTSPAGTVQFVDTTTGATLGSATITTVSGQEQATLTTAAVAGGDTITATYTSSNSLSSSSGTTTVSTATTNLTLTSSSSTTSSSGLSVTLTANIAVPSGGTTAAGTVQFVDTTTGTTLGSAAVTVVGTQGQATLTTTSAKSGDTITATYTSSNNLSGSSNTTTVGAATSSSQTQQWLNAVYETLLHRPVDASGLAYWSSAIGSGTSASQVVYYIEVSSEYQINEIQAAFQSLLGTSAPASAVSYLLGLMQQGASFQTVEAVIAGSSSFYAANGNSTQGFLNAVYEDFLGRPVDAAGETEWGSLLAAGYNPTQIVLGIMGTQEYQTDLVEQDYQTYLGRQADPTSLAAFVSNLSGGTMNNDMIVATLIGSGEFVS